MLTAEFERLVSIGLGRAVLHLRDNDARPFRDAILDACLHNKAHDAQIDGGRAEYMVDLINASGDAAFFENAVIQSIGEPPKDWDTEQRFQIARLLAQSGNQLARQAMYSAFPTLGKSSSDVASEFIELDGIDGLLFVAGEIGVQLAHDPDRWENGELLFNAAEICGKEAVESSLAVAAFSNAGIRTYLDATEASRNKNSSVSRPDVSVLSYGEVKERIASRNASGILAKWGRTASDADIALAAHDLVQEMDPKRLIDCLRMFRQRPFPLNVDLLLRLVVSQPDGPIPRHALSALANVEDEKVRSLAFSLVETGASNRIYAVDLLIKNFREGDHEIIAAWWNAETDPDYLQSFGSSLVTFFAAHPGSPIEIDLLRNLYERQPCAHCRSSVVERLLELRALTDDLRRECEYDSYLETRDLVRFQPWKHPVFENHVNHGTSELADAYLCHSGAVPRET
jgi:hypothetical protein